MGVATKIDPNAPPTPVAPAAPVQTGKATMIDPNAPAPAPAATPTPGASSGTATAIDPNQGSVAGTGSWGDFGSVMSNESMMNSLPGLRLQAEAARKRLGPNWSAAADAAGSIGSPSSLLNLVPGVGPELAGGVHEGVKSYMSQPDWLPSSSGLAQIGKDTAGGVATAGLGHGTAELAPKLLPEFAKWVAAQGLPAGAAAHYLHDAFGEIGVSAGGALGVFGLLNRPGDWARAAAEKISDQPATQNTIKLLAQGAGSALRNSSPGPLWDQWVPGQ
jgi:hypothetical protein